MNAIQFIKELDELGLSVCNCSGASWIHNKKSVITYRPVTIKDLTYQNRIDIIRECKRNLNESKIR